MVTDPSVIPDEWLRFFQAVESNEKFVAGKDIFELFGGSMTAGKTPPAAFKGGTTGVSPIDWSGMKVETDAPYKPGGFGPVPSTFPPAQIGGLLGIMGTDDEYWKTILGN